MLSLFKKFGEALFQTGINASHSGNISVRSGNKIYITRTGAMLGDLCVGDIVETDLNEETIGIASREILVHRAIYKETSANAILHSHPPYTVALSMVMNEIVPIDSEGNFFLGNVPILETDETIGAEEVAKKIPGLIKKHGKVAVLKYHGLFAIGENLEDAFLWTTSLEKSAQMIYLTKTLSPSAYRRAALKYKNKNKSGGY